MIKIPVVIGHNRLRGKSTGAMVDDDFGEDNLGHLRNLLRKEAKMADVDPTPDWLSLAVGQILRLYEQAHAAWVAKKEDTIGHVYEATMPSGTSILMGDRRTLARLH